MAFCSQELQTVFSGQVKVIVSRNGKHQLLVGSSLGNAPDIVDEVSSVFQLWIHNHGHEIVVLDDLQENVLHILVLKGHQFDLWSILFGLFSVRIKAPKSVKQRLISVHSSIECDGAPILYLDEQVLMVLDRLPGNPIIHGLAGEGIDLLHDGVGLLLGVTLIASSSLSTLAGHHIILRLVHPKVLALIYRRQVVVISFTHS